MVLVQVTLNVHRQLTTENFKDIAPGREVWKSGGCRNAGPAALSAGGQLSSWGQLELT